MMQTMLVIALLVLALAYLGWQFYQRFFAKKESCESCAMGKISEDKH
jgi:hypothetical protein